MNAAVDKSRGFPNFHTTLYGYNIKGYFYLEPGSIQIFVPKLNARRPSEVRLGGG